MRYKMIVSVILVIASMFGLTGCAPKYTLTRGDYENIPCSYHYYSDNYCAKTPSIGKLTERGAEDQYFCENHYYTYGKVLVGEVENVVDDAGYRASACPYCDYDNLRGISFVYNGVAMCTYHYIQTIKANEAAE